MQCPMCSKHLVESWGNRTNGFLVVSDFPSEMEINQGRWWAGRDGDLLSQEFRMVGIPPQTFYFTGAWKHAVSRTVEEKTIMKRILEDEIRAARTVLFIGSSVEMVLGVDPVSVCGMIFTLDKFPNLEFAVATGSFRGSIFSTVGDFRLGFNKYAKEVRKCLTV